METRKRDERRPRATDKLRCGEDLARALQKRGAGRWGFAGRLSNHLLGIGQASEGEGGKGRVWGNLWRRKESHVPFRSVFPSPRGEVQGNLGHLTSPPKSSLQKKRKKGKGGKKRGGG